MLHLQIMLCACFLSVEGRLPADCPAIKALFSDFDRTVTTEDTLVILKTASDAYRFGSYIERKRLDEQWNAVIASIAQQKRSLFQQIFTSVFRKTVDIAGLESVIRVVENIYEKAVKVEQALGMLNKIEEYALARAVLKIQLFKDSLEVLRKFGAAVRIVSNNLSEFLIWATLRGYVPSSQIFANRILHNGISNGTVDFSVKGAFDKRQVVFTQLKKMSEPGISVYIGDSVHDFLAMLVVDVPILMNGSKDTQLIAVRYGIRLKTLKSSSLQAIRAKKDNVASSPTFYTTSSWDIIEKFLECKDSQ